MKNKFLVILVGVAALLAIAVLSYWQISSFRTENAQGAPPENQPVAPLTEPFTILLIGEDTGEPGETTQRSDAILLAALDPGEQKIKLASILRDTYVDIPGEQSTRINHAYEQGGPELLLETLNQTFGLSVAHYAQVDFQRFGKIIDTLGGIELSLTPEETEQVFYERRETGVYLLNGAQAESYARIRVIDNDFGRTARQRALLFGIYHKFQADEEEHLLELFWELFPYVETNLEAESFLTLYRQYRLMGEVSLSELSLPVDNGFEEKVIYGQSVLLPDLTVNTAALHQFLYGLDAPLPETAVRKEIPPESIWDPDWMIAQRAEQSRLEQESSESEKEGVPTESSGLEEAVAAPQTEGAPVPEEPVTPEPEGPPTATG